MTEPRRTVLVAVGTDCHQFDRLVGWVDRWLAAGAETRAQVVVQHGTSHPPERAKARGFLTHGELLELLRAADVVVCHGGPATITEARRLGHLPIVVPRDERLGEHVDDHQRRFARRVAREGLVALAETEDVFGATLDRALADPDAFSVAAPEAGVTAAVRQFEELVSPLLPVQRREDPALVAYIGGVGRSGTTLLDRLLGQLPGWVSVGELVHLWERGVRDNERCGCGERFHDCAFWQGVGEHAFGGWSRVDVGHILELKRGIDRNRYIPAIASPVPLPAFRERHRRYAAIVTRVYRAVLAVSGGRVVVDSSKHSSFAYFLSRTPGVDLRVVHCVRDARGVSYSWSKSVQRPEVVDGQAFMPVYSPTEVSMLWLLHNALFGTLARLGVPTTMVRYEDLLARPVGEVDRVARFVTGDTDTATLPAFLDARSVELAPAHTVAGNPMRFRTGRIELTPDMAWRQQLPVGSRRLVSTLTWPLRYHYGYR